VADRRRMNGRSMLDRDVPGKSRNNRVEDVELSIVIVANGCRILLISRVGSGQECGLDYGNNEGHEVGDGSGDGERV
jgi:hypothetical protein